MLRVSNLSKSFGGVQAVDDCSFNVEPRTITALIGPNGAGKTTLFNLVCGLLEADEGTIELGTTDLTGLPSWKRSRAGISRTFQLSRLFKNLSVEDNLLLALRTDDDCFFRMLWRGESDHAGERKKVLEAMRAIGLEKDPSTPVADLSYGQQKLFDLARAFLNPHQILLLDEPVAGVNTVLREQLKKILQGLRGQGETVLLIEHDMDFVRAVTDQVIVMDQGRVLTSGKPELVLKDKKVLEAYLGMDV